MPNHSPPMKTPKVPIGSWLASKSRETVMAGIRTPAKQYLSCLVGGKQRDPKNAKKQKGELILGKVWIFGHGKWLTQRKQVLQI